jgi:hypothetical protein
VKLKWIVSFVSLAAISIVIATQLTIFVIPPIGAIPEGKTLIITRLTEMQFVDSADAMCLRKMNGVSILCRAMALGAVSKNSNILLRLPYSGYLYLWTTGGVTY